MKRLAVCCLLVWGIVYQPSDDQRSQAALLRSPVVSQLDADTYGTLSVNGYTRNFVYAVSAAAAPATGRPLVIHLHGDGAGQHPRRVRQLWEHGVDRGDGDGDETRYEDERAVAERAVRHIRPPRPETLPLFP